MTSWESFIFFLFSEDEIDLYPRGGNPDIDRLLYLIHIHSFPVRLWFLWLDFYFAFASVLDKKTLVGRRGFEEEDVYVYGPSIYV